MNGNGALTYPVGLITTYEITYAGGTYGTSNSSFYLYTGEYFWTLSPSHVNSAGAAGFGLTSNGNFGSINVYGFYGVRPSVSLKSGTAISGGSGTATDPFIVN